MLWVILCVTKYECLTFYDVYKVEVTIADKEEICFLFRAQQSLIDICDQISLAKLSPPQITFTGLSHFNNKVLYMDPVKDDHLDALTRIAGIN